MPGVLPSELRMPELWLPTSLLHLAADFWLGSHSQDFIKARASVSVALVFSPSLTSATTSRRRWQVWDLVGWRAGPTVCGECSLGSVGSVPWGLLVVLPTVCGKCSRGLWGSASQGVQGMLPMVLGSAPRGLRQCSAALSLIAVCRF